MKSVDTTTQENSSSTSVALDGTLAPEYGEVTGSVLEKDGELWYAIRRADRMKPFLMTLASDSDHWLFLLSNGGLTAGRINPDHALLPYYTQDKMIDMAGVSGSTTLLRDVGVSGPAGIWAPFSDGAEWDDRLERNVYKNLLGNHIVLEEINTATNLVYRISWRPSERFGFVRKVEILNQGNQAVELDVLDGLRNLVPPGLDQRFQNEFSILGDAYKQSELVQPENLGMYHLSSVPTDLAEPMEALKATVVWQSGLEGVAHLLSDAQVTEFRRTGQTTPEKEVRGQRGAYLTVSRMQIEPGGSRSWYLCADVDKDRLQIEALREFIKGTDNAAAAIEADCAGTGQRMQQMLASADGFQITADQRRCMRHTSNTLFNLMRGGVFPTGYDMPVDDVLATVKTFNKQAAKELKSLLKEGSSLSCYDPWDSSHSLNNGGKDVLRLLREYLPLSFSRRHGDPSRPWNRFSIEIKEDDGSPRFFYQGNWRDIFQNWEALMYSCPEYTEAAICRFLNASTADGYNPYRVTKDGFDWEVIEPSDPWANIGYWGDHQIIYLLRLLETSVKFHPGRLKDLLQEETFVYADVPYRIRSFKECYENPRETVDYDTEAENRINGRVAQIGADGKLHHTREGQLVHVCLMEKLLNPLLAKLSNFVPGGGIWMNTQRPEWNDANNALVGYGISVVTLGYVARYLRFMVETFGDSLQENEFQLSTELAQLMERLSAVFANNPAELTPSERFTFMKDLGGPASNFRHQLYEDGLSGGKSVVSGQAILAFLNKALIHADRALRENKRSDNLWHSYNLLRTGDKAAGVGHLVVMLEGQVSILSSGLLNAEEILSLLQSLRNSDLYREDQNSFLLYPNKQMPGFLEKNSVDLAEAEANPLLARMLEEGSTAIISKSSSGEAAFNGNFHNANDLKKALVSIEGDSGDKEAILALFESTFNHHAFTGRSGTFFAYEGLGSIYWHMVSKLVLAVQENYRSLKGTCSAEQSNQLLTCFREFRDGLGVNKNPAIYGAFPTDAYSHTPAHAGAQQPGMTGQVKEDILIRLAELGVHIHNGLIHFNPDMLEEEEFLKEARSFTFLTMQGKEISMDLFPQSLAFSFCQVPVVYQRGCGAEEIELSLMDGTTETIAGLTLSAAHSRDIFMHTGAVTRVDIKLL